jgi:hypothetical protein
MRNAQTFGPKLERWWPAGRCTLKRKDNIVRDVKEIRYSGVCWIQLVKDRFQYVGGGDSCDTVMNFRFP